MKSGCIPYWVTQFECLADMSHCLPVVEGRRWGQGASRIECPADMSQRLPVGEGREGRRGKSCRVCLFQFNYLVFPRWGSADPGEINDKWLRRQEEVILDSGVSFAISSYRDNSVGCWAVETENLKVMVISIELKAVIMLFLHLTDLSVYEDCDDADYQRRRGLMRWRGVGCIQYM